MESYKGKQQISKPLLLVGDVVVLKNDGTKRTLWKSGKIAQLFSGWKHKRSQGGGVNGKGR